MPFSPEPVADKLGRPVRDLRVSVIDRCNFRCPYCMPAEIFGAEYQFLKDPRLMSRHELRRLLRAFVALGVEKLRFTGGEPLLRPDVPELVAFAKQDLRVPDVALTTNGWLLERAVPELREAGLDRVNVSLDSLDPEIFGVMNGRGYGPDRVLRGIAAAAEAGLEIKINAVIQRGVNENDVLPLARRFREGGQTLRFIEYMDVGNHNGWRSDAVLPSREVVERIDAVWPLERVPPRYPGEVATRYRYKDGAGEIGVISSITQPFCRSCNRVRLSADGKLFTCLFAVSGHDALGRLRSGATDQEMDDWIASIWRSRADRYSEERAERRKDAVPEKVEMSYIGG